MASGNAGAMDLCNRLAKPLLQWGAAVSPAAQVQLMLRVPVQLGVVAWADG